MTFIKNQRRLIAMLACTTFILSACSAPSGVVNNNNPAPSTGAAGVSKAKTKVTWLQYWKSEVGEKPLNDLKAGFEAKNPDIELDIQDMPFSQMHDKLVTLHAAGNVPDLILLTSPWVAEFAASGITEPLDTYYNAMPKEFQTSNEGPYWSPWKGKHYGMGFITGNTALFYNKKKLAEANLTPPTTWDEYRSASIKLADASKNKFAFTGNMASEPPSTINTELWPFILQAGGKLTENNKAVFNSPEGVKALEFYKGLIKTDKVATPGELSAGEKEKRSNFSAENTAFMFDGPWGIAIQKTANPNLDFGVVPMPKGAVGATIAGGGAIGMMSKSKNKDAAWKVMTYMMEPSTQIAWAKATNNFPHNKTALKDDYIQKNPLLKVFADQNESLKPINPDLQLPESTVMRKIMINEIQNYLTDKKTAQQALDDAATGWNAVFDKYK
ncbi:ABC transporter substrate-binding protein [Paenibacillus periandrae]|uniref:ABC transporter substrate-binding protein n=1 Tax=Paenibacillus periandrae TaxID=1761741 RepID=UPI001F09903F|nr:ABC transporter substrate-binding protein [Paenibacillus periandrae]